MTDADFQALVAQSRILSNDQKVHLIKALLGDQSAEVRLPSQREEVKVFGMEDVEQLLITIANSLPDYLSTRGGARLRFELYTEIAA